MISSKSIPKNPGCYLFKDGKGKVIYVGKAKNLSKRVKSYFVRGHDVKTNALVSKIVDTDFIVTDSEVEALILENNLIKKYRPKYNIDLKDSRQYAYIQVTGEKFPKLIISRTKMDDGKWKIAKSRFYGPFVSGLGRDYVLRVLRNTFRIRTCKKLPKKRCMRFEIGLCSGPCEELISKTDYLADVKNAEMVLRGKTKTVVDILNKKMREFSRDKNFERALVSREQIRAVKDLGERQKMERGKKFDEDFVNYIIHENRIYLILFNARKGNLENKQFFEFGWTPNFLEEFLVQFYSNYDCPREVVLPEGVDSGLRSFLKEKGAKVVVPKRGEKLKLSELVKRNIEISVFGDSEKVVDLRDKLGLNFLPRVIECFDVSHLSGTSTVASMVQFRNGKADKNNYRKFKLRNIVGVDDYAGMIEVVRRRYSKLKKEGLEMPDLIVVDGGKGQVSVAVEVLESLGLKIVVIGLAKREERVFFPGKSNGVKLDRRGAALKLLIEIRDEAHRFAINYNRLLRSKKMKGF